VNSTYSGAAEPALSDVSFSAGPGEITAIVGGSGSGKTTLVSLIPRFYDVGGGAVLLDGMDIREMAQETLRRRIGFVPQKAQLFTGTIARNIRFGNEAAADAEVLHAARVAQAGEFIAAMGEGMDAPVSQGGVNLSGGQRQRLAIARALAIRPEIYIFDDSFSALDFRTDALVRCGLRKEMAGSTVFIVAQRVATVMDAERIVVLDEGRVTGIGAHNDLMRRCAVYREIVRSQLGEGEAA
jgi:ATP-binding cassette subfamily B protein